MAASVDNIQRLILDGLQQRIAKVYGTAPAYITHNNRLRLSAYLQRVKNGEGNSAQTDDKFTYPLLFLKPQRLAKNTAGYNPTAMQHRPFYGRTPGSNLLREHKWVPTIFTFEFIQVSPDFWDMMHFAVLSLQNNVTQGGLSFSLDYDGVPVDVRVEVTDSVDLPEKDSNIDQPDWYETTTTINVQGFVGDDLSKVMSRQVIALSEVVSKPLSQTT